ncbi:stage II sporulation protein M [Halalkalibacillus halophilus]|uniref:stage II sporulation protein M n=1 Tax=Halalkalibacillus halophilus TaxID=392827 RepID=UPI0004009EF5|nr:stage II sporulation protein M [Halalkalibacillus halophilus]
MKQLLKNIKLPIRLNEPMFVFLFTLLIIGIIFGSLLVSSLTFIQSQDLYFFIEQYFNVMGESEQNKLDLFYSALMTHGKYSLFLFLFGLSFIGLPVVWFLIFLKGCVIGFTVGFLVQQLAWNGFLLSTVSIAPQNLVIIPAYIFIAASSMIFSIQVVQALFINNSKKQTISPYLLMYAKTYLIAFILIIIGSFIEAFISSSLMMYLQ